MFSDWEKPRTLHGTSVTPTQDSYSLAHVAGRYSTPAEGQVLRQAWGSFWHRQVSCVFLTRKSELPTLQEDGSCFPINFILMPSFEGSTQHIKGERPAGIQTPLFSVISDLG